jgi:hypothetical protein
MMPGEVIGMTSGAESVRDPSSSGGRVSLDELARRKGVRPVASLEEMREDGVFGSDEELEQFLEYVQAARHSDLG